MLTVLLLAWPAAAAGIAVLVETSAGLAHQEVAETVRRGLAGTAGPVAVVNGAEFAALPKADLRLVVAVGVRALETGLGADSPVPVLATLIPRESYEILVRQAGKRRTTALFIDQPLERQFELLRIALPERRRVAVLLGPDAAQRERSLRSTGEKYGMTVSVAQVTEAAALHETLQLLLPKADILLAVPDALVYGSANLRNVLRAAYGAGVPLAAFAPSYVKAGALLALFSTPAQVGRQTLEMAQGILSGSLPPPQYPHEFQIETNAYIRRTLGLDLADDTALADALRKQEQRR